MQGRHGKPGAGRRALKNDTSLHITYKSQRAVTPESLQTNKADGKPSKRRTTSKCRARQRGQRQFPAPDEPPAAASPSQDCWRCASAPLHLYATDYPRFPWTPDITHSADIRSLLS